MLFRSPLPSLLLPCRRLASSPFLQEANSGIKDHRSSDLDSIHYTRRAKTLGAMDPQLKLALEAQTRSFISELDKKFADHDAKWESRVGELEKAAVSAADQFYDLKADIHTDVTAQLEFFVSSATEQANRVAAATTSRVVTATYELGEGMKGTIGIIGPKRMDYEHAVSYTHLGEIVINTPSPAISNAIQNATGVIIRELPMTAEKIYRGISGR